MRRDVQHGQVGDDAVHHAHARERQRALGQDLQINGAVLLLGHVFHQHHHALDAGHQVHGTAHALDHLAGDHPVGQIALRAHLHGTQDGQVDLAATDHGKAVVAAEDAGAGDGGHGLLAGVDEVGVHLVLGGKRADAQHAVFALQPDLDVSGHEVGHQGRQADAQVHVEAVLQLAGGAGRHFVMGPGHGQTPSLARTVRFSMRFSGVALSTRRCT